MRWHTRAISILPGLPLSLALLAACGGGDNGSPPPAPESGEISREPEIPAQERSGNGDEEGGEDREAPEENTSGAAYEPASESLSQHPLPQWWQDARFGTFIHWGLYWVPAWAPPDEMPVQLSSGRAAYAEWCWLAQQLPLCPAWQHHLDTYGTDFVHDDLFPSSRRRTLIRTPWSGCSSRTGPSTSWCAWSKGRALTGIDEGRMKKAPGIKRGGRGNDAGGSKWITVNR